MSATNGDDATGQAAEGQLKATELEGEELENFDKLKEYGISKTVAIELVKVYRTGKIRVQNCLVVLATEVGLYLWFCLALFFMVLF